MKRKKVIAPKDATTFEKVCSLPRDNIEGRGWWAILHLPDVVLSQQKNGEASTGTVKIPRKDFERLARWYLTGRMTP